MTMMAFGAATIEGDSMACHQAKGSDAKHLLLDADACYNVTAAATLATAVTTAAMAQVAQACRASALNGSVAYLSGICLRDRQKPALEVATTTERGRKTSNDTEVRYGIIGTGMMGVEHVFNLAEVDGAKITAVADPHGPSRQAAIRATGHSSLRVFANHKDLLDSGLCDVVVVATPNMTHADILLDVIRHSSRHHVLVEKPLCTTIADCKRVLSAANFRRDMLINVGLEYRYMPPIARLIAEVKKGAIGKVMMVAIREHRFPFLVKVNNWNRFSRNTGGTLVEKCCHFFDLMNVIMGSRPIRVMASGSQAMNHLDEVYNGEVPDILDNAYVIVDYASGARALLDLCMFAEGSRNEQEVAVTGSTGKIEAFVPESIVRIGSRGGGRAGVQTFECHDERIKYEGLHHGSSYLEHLDFIGAVRSHGEMGPMVGLEEGMLAVAMGVAAHRSIELGRPVEIKEVLDEEL